MSVVPFGLTFGEPPSARTRVEPWMRQAVLDPTRQIAVIDGRPVAELIGGGLLAGSSPTETDGDSPISTDSDPVYD